ncbi:MAG: hypothetical protein WA738_20190 [Candidatus Angelobacter sp.]
MKYLCPKCGRTEIVIGDASPNCRLCRVPMLKPTMQYTNLLMSPIIVMRRFKSTIEKHGWKKTLTGRFKQEREACIAAIWAYGVQHITNVREYWVEVVTMDQTPDCKVIFFDTSAGYNHRKIMNLEIVEWDEHRENMLELIEQKCGKAYPPYFFLVVFVRNDKETMVEDILQKIKSLKVPFAEIWILGRLPVSIGAYRLFLAHPEPTKLVDFDVFESYRQNISQIDFMQAEGRSKSTERTDRGLLYLPIP